LSVNALKDRLTKVWQYNNEDKFNEVDPANADAYGVKITSAGRFFTFIQADYEFFASRYSKSLPIIFIRDYTALEEIMRSIYDRVEKLTDAVVNSERSIFGEVSSYKHHYNYEKVNEVSKEITEIKYPLRIIRNHRSYLRHLKAVVDDYIQQKKNYLLSGRDLDLIDLIDKYIELYAGIHRRLIENGYLNENNPREGL